MSIDFVPTPVPPITVAQYLKTLDERGETYSFLASASFQNIQRPHVRAGIELNLFRDDSDDPLKIRLMMDGTWTAEHILVVGDKQ